MNKERIHKLVIKPCDIDNSKGCFQINTNNNLLLCDDCKSPLFYIKINWGVVIEDNFYGIMYNKNNRVYCLREIGFVVYCAECSSYKEDYGKYFYPEDKIILSHFDLEELDDDERAEIHICLNQFNQKGDFTSRYKSGVFVDLKNKLIEYEKKHKIKENKKINNKLKRKK